VIVPDSSAARTTYANQTACRRRHRRPPTDRDCCRGRLLATSRAQLANSTPQNERTTFGICRRRPHAASSDVRGHKYAETRRSTSVCCYSGGVGVCLRATVQSSLASSALLCVRVSSPCCVPMRHCRRRRCCCCCCRCGCRCYSAP